MPKNEYILARGKDTPTLIAFPDGTEWKAPVLDSLLGLPADAVGNGKIGENAGGMEVVALNRAYKLIDAKDASGAAALIVCTVTFRRAAANEMEQERIDKAVLEAKTRSNQSKERRQAEITESNTRMVESYRQGQIDAVKAQPIVKPVSIGETIREALDVAAVIHNAGKSPLSLTDGK